MSGKLIVFGDGHTVVNAGAYEDENTPLGLPDVDRDFQNGGPGGGSSHQHLRFAAPAQWHQQTVAYNSMSTESQPAQHRHEHRVVDTRAQVTCGLPMMMHSQPVSQLQIPAFIPPLGSEPELLNKDEIDGMYLYADGAFGHYPGRQKRRKKKSAKEQFEVGELQSRQYAGAPIGKAMVYAGYIAVIAYVGLAVLSLVLRYQYTWATASVGSAALMYAAVCRGQTPPALDFGCCSGFGPNVWPGLWYGCKFVGIAAVNMYSWFTVHASDKFDDEHIRVIMYSVLFWLLVAADTGVHVAKPNFDLFSVGAMTTGFLLLLNITIMYRKLTYDEPAFAVLCGITTLFHVPLQVLSSRHDNADLRVCIVEVVQRRADVDETERRRQERQQQRRRGGPGSGDDDDELLHYGES